MATGIDFSPPFTLLEGGGYNKDNVSATSDESSDSFNSLKQMTSGKPPRHLSVMRHSVSSIKLLGQADLVSLIILTFSLFFGDADSIHSFLLNIICIMSFQFHGMV